MIGTIASQQLVSLRRQRIFTALLAMFLAMTVIAGVLGWSSHQTIVRVYGEAARLLTASGEPAPPNPFLLKPVLSQLSNMVVYVPLLGALLAVVLGHLSISGDEANGISRLIFSRPVSRHGYLSGKILGASVVIAMILLAGLVVSAVSLLLIDGSVPSVQSLWRLALFYSLSWIYLMVFVLVGMAATLGTHRKSIALLTAMSAWLILTFAIPQFTSGLRPTSSLNPIVEPVSTSQRLFQITALARPYSVAEQYKEASGRILATATSEPVWATVQRVLPIVGLLAMMVGVSFLLVRKHDFTGSETSE